MTPEDSKLLRDIHSAMFGDPINGRPGLVHHQHRVNEDMYGLDAHGQEIEGKRNTVMVRISSLEDNQKKITWIGTGVLLACAAVKFGWTALVSKLFGGTHE